MPCWSGFWDLLGASRFVASTLLDAPHDNPTSRKILRTPKDYGMDFQSVTFPALDGSKVSAWYIPAKDPSSKKLAIVGHQSWSYANKSGMQTLRMFVVLKQIGIDYVKLHKVLYDAGFHVVAYDMRNHGESEARKPSGYGEVEYQDAAGVMDWVNAHPALGDCRVCLLPFCVSGIAFLKANALYPEKFRNVVAWATTNVFDLRTSMIKNPYGMGMLDEKLVSKALQEKHESYLKTGACQPNPHITFAMEHISGKTWARALKVPVLFCDPRDDWLFNHINDAPPIFAEFGADLPEDKKRRNEFHWIGTRQPGPFKTKTDNRCEGYNYYQSESGSKVMLEFFGKWCP